MDTYSFLSGELAALSVAVETLMRGGAPSEAVIQARLEALITQSLYLAVPEEYIDGILHVAKGHLGALA